MEEEPHVNIVTRSGFVTGDDKGKKKVEETWITKTTEKAPRFNIQKQKETFMGAKRSFMDVGTSISSGQPKLIPKKEYDEVSTLMQELDPSILELFL